MVKQAENFRVRRLVKKIGSRPHREALQADLQQKNAYNPFSENSKATIREMGNVELFEFCETIPTVQCSQYHLYWNQGVIYCTCGHLLVERETRQKDQIKTGCSLPHYIIKKVRPQAARHGKTEAQKQYRIAFNAWKRCRKTVDGQEEHHEGIHDRFLRDQICLDSQLKIGWTEQKSIKMEKLAREDHSYHLSRDEEDRGTELPIKRGEQIVVQNVPINAHVIHELGDISALPRQDEFGGCVVNPVAHGCRRLSPERSCLRQG